MVHTKKLKVVFLGVSLILGGSLASIIFFTSIKRGDEIVLFIVGDPNLDNFLEELNSDQIDILTELYYKYWSDYVEILAENWEFDFECFPAKLCNFKKYRYNELLVFFIGHGNNDSSPYFTISNTNRIEVADIPSKIDCENLTVVVDSCFSYYWQIAFFHQNLNAIYTSDLTNTTSSWTIVYKVDSLTGEITLKRIDSYSRYFLFALINGYSYLEANETAYNIMQYY